ncbi:flagellar hook-associated protein FlgL [Massilia sp. MB5]|uniref:flagellar hook-associated protein FlgL n=1 Tax=unclassified Massilia TaxID=2609279 RepID=UPI00067BA3A3|nr:MULTISPECIES: flagellar hook-associated protein FlgL [unclassified Massilia]AKU20624.1 flagellar biosynthesis protein FlgL [Massilia sp. NR 4-1]UMR29903.1 flagellar hook-associated protein FlgL [Massilia sp. MB5]
MRIASSQFQASMNRSLGLNQEALSKLTEKMASGSKLLVPSDDPIANVRISRLLREESIVNQYRDNIAAVKIRLAHNETYMQGMVNDLNEARDLMVLALDTHNTPADLNAIATPLRSLLDSIYYNGNTRDQEGKYIFSGTLTATAPLTDTGVVGSGTRFSYAGNTAKQDVVVGSGIVQAANVDVSGVEVLLNKMDLAAAALAAPTASPTNAATRAALTANLNAIDDAIGLVAGRIAEFGGAQNVITTLGNNHANVSLSNQSALNDLSQLDYAVAATDLNGYNIALQATYKAYTKISDLSLFKLL